MLINKPETCLENVTNYILAIMDKNSTISFILYKDRFPGLTEEILIEVKEILKKKGYKSFITKCYSEYKITVENNNASAIDNILSGALLTITISLAIYCLSQGLIFSFWILIALCFYSINFAIKVFDKSIDIWE